MSTTPSSAEAIASEIIAMERAALTRWANGDPDGFLEISQPDVRYFDPFQKKRVDGREALKQIYDTIRGQIRIPRWEIIDPKVDVCGEVAVLSFNFMSEGDTQNHWNTTEVYRRCDGAWRIIHTHWSLTASN